MNLQKFGRFCRCPAVQLKLILATLCNQQLCNFIASNESQYWLLLRKKQLDFDKYHSLVH